MSGVSPEAVRGFVHPDVEACRLWLRDRGLVYGPLPRSPDAIGWWSGEGALGRLGYDPVEGAWEALVWPARSNRRAA
jgi:hypothetical protein